MTQTVTLSAAMQKRIDEVRRIMRDADDLRERLHEFAPNPLAQRAIAAVMNGHDPRNPQQAEFLHAIARGMTAVVFTLEQFRAVVECDTGHEWIDSDD